MSTWFEEPVTCRRCGENQLARLAHGVHVTRAPEIREQLFGRTFHAVTCNVCKHTFVAERPLVYTDIDRRHWIQVEREAERSRWPEYEPAVDATFERAFIGSPLARELSERMKVRLVFGLEELREKLVIWRANLSDAAMECLKIELIRREPTRLRGRMIIDDVSADHTLTCVVGDKRIAVDSATVEQFDADTRLEARFPELFGGRYVSYTRLTGARYRWAEPT